MLDGSVFINPLTMCEVTVTITNAEHETIEQTVRLGYYRARMNKAFLASVDQLLRLPDDAEIEEVKPILYPAFLQLVHWWNVKRGADMWPLTMTDIEPMDPYIIGVLLFGVIRHARGGAAGEAGRGQSAQATLPATSEAGSGALKKPTLKKPTSLRSPKRLPA